MCFFKQLKEKLAGGRTGATLLERGSRFFSEGNLQAALAHFNEAIELSSDASEEVAAYFNRGRTYGRMGHWDAAVADFDRVVVLAPAFPLVYLERGSCFALKEDYGTAIADYGKAIALLPPGLEQAMAYCNRGVTYDALGDYQAALADISKAIEIAPEFNPAYKEKERVQERALDAGSDPGAQFTPKHPPVASAEQYCERGWAASETNDLVDALVLFSQAIEQSPSYPNAYYGRGVVNARLRRYKQAIADLNEALELVPRWPAALAERGLVYVELGDYGKGMQDYDKAIGIDPTYAIAHINKGSLYALQDKWGDALVSLDRGISLGPTPEAHFNRAAVCEQTGEYQQAIKDLQIYLQLRPQDPLVGDVRRRLTELEEELKRH